MKVRNSFVNGPSHLLKQLELVRMQKKKVQQLVAPHIARSAWYSHSEAVLQTLLCSEEQEERTKAVKEILKLRDGREEDEVQFIAHLTLMQRNWMSFVPGTLMCMSLS